VAFKSCCEEVGAGQFPDDKQSYGINPAELEKLEAALSNHEAALQR
jgi:hypothetical protein